MRSPSITCLPSADSTTISRLSLVHRYSSVLFPSQSHPHDHNHPKTLSTSNLGHHSSFQLIFTYMLCISCNHTRVYSFHIIASISPQSINPSTTHVLIECAQCVFLLRILFAWLMRSICPPLQSFVWLKSINHHSTIHVNN